MVLAATWIVLDSRGFEVSWGILLAVVALGLVAASITLGNWMDRRTRLELGDTTLHFQNGLRNVKLTWDEVREVRVLPARWGKKVQVFSYHSYFSFQTLGEVRLMGEVKGWMGFARGEEILRQIILKSNLQIADHPGEGYYYTRM